MTDYSQYPGDDFRTPEEYEMIEEGIRKAKKEERRLREKREREEQQMRERLKNLYYDSGYEEWEKAYLEWARKQQEKHK